MTHSYQQIHRIAVSTIVLALGVSLVSPDFAVATDLAIYGGLGGNPLRGDCPKGSYLVGLAGRTGAWVNRIAPICAPWRRGSQTFGTPTVGQFFGTSGGGQERHESCLRSGTNNRAVQSWWVHLLRSDNHFVQFVQMYCTSLTSPVSEVSGHRLDFGSKPDSVEEMVTTGPFISHPPFQACPDGEVAVGIRTRAGRFVDAVGLICGPLPISFGAPSTKVIPSAKAPVSPTAKKANPLVKGPTDDMFTITRPAWNDRVQQSKLIVAAKQPKVGMTPVTELQFKWVDALKTQQPYINKFAVDTPTLLKGYSVDEKVTRGQAGRWEVRARASGKTVPGPWSFPVLFNLFLTQPTQSQKKASPVPQSSPLPSSSVVQPPSQGSSTVPQMIHPPTTPSQGSGGFSGMIRRRGVEGDEGTTTGDQAPAEQKP